MQAVLGSKERLLHPSSRRDAHQGDIHWVDTEVQLRNSVGLMVVSTVEVVLTVEQEVGSIPEDSTVDVEDLEVVSGDVDLEATGEDREDLEGVFIDKNHI